MYILIIDNYLQGGGSIYEDEMLNFVKEHIQDDGSLDDVLVFAVDNAESLDVESTIIVTLG